VRPKAQRRRYSAEFKRRILQEADACSESGEVGALLRREGLYASHLNTWRRQRQQGELAGLTPAKRGRKVDAQAVELAQLKRENERLQAQLERAELIIDVQKKLSRLLGQSETASDERK
jgi:transposase-like protein